jgi:hypothetical protein
MTRYVITFVQITSVMWTLLLGYNHNNNFTVFCKQNLLSNIFKERFVFFFFVMWSTVLCLRMYFTLAPLVFTLPCVPRISFVPSHPFLLFSFPFILALHC